MDDFSIVVLNVKIFTVISFVILQHKSCSRIAIHNQYILINVALADVEWFLFSFCLSIWFQGLDFVILEARKNRVRLILSLVNNLDAYGGKSQYVMWAREAGSNVSTSTDSFFSDPTIKDYYKAYIKVYSYFVHVIEEYLVLAWRRIWEYTHL